MEYTNHGELNINEANDMNIPVCCFLHAPGEDDNDSEGLWEWTANNYMPRKNFIAEGQYKITAKTKEDILAAIQKYVVPLYQIAVSSLSDSGTLYYWQKD